MRKMMIGISFSKFEKRAFDLLFSFLGLILLFPIILIISAIVLILLGRPIFFIQQRPGLFGKPFRMIKFRTMKIEYDKNAFLLSDANRLTSFGKLLRKTSLDELPEIINVLKAEMSFVGPRPLLMQYLPLYTKEQLKRHTVLPGITGWAQINGRNAISWDEKFKLDIWYVENHTLWLDMKIIFITVWKTIRRDGISHPRHVTMEEFLGTKE